MTASVELKPVQKQTARIGDAVIVPSPYGTGNKVMCGIAEDHPRSYLNGQDITTSTVISRKGNIVETRNTIYTVTSWAGQEVDKLVKSREV